METRANYVIVGIFTLVAILAAFAFVYWTANIGDRGETTTLRVRIPGSASGLGRGSFVLFNGVKVGDVRRVYIDVDDPTIAVADTEIDRMTPITRSTQADIGLAGLTGQANIELTGANPKEPKLLDEAEKDGRVAVIVAKPSAVTNLLQTAQDIASRADKVLSEFEGFAKDVRGPLTQTAQNAEKFSDALAKNSSGIDKFLSSVSALSTELQGVSGKLDGALKAAEGLLNSVDRDKVKNIVANVDEFTLNLSKTSDQFKSTIAEVKQAVGSINDFATKTQVTLDKVNGVLDSVDPADVRTALANIKDASANAGKASADIAKVTEKVAARSDDIQQTIEDAQQLAERLNNASVRIDGILAKVDGMLGSGDTKGLVAQASETLKSFKQVADTLNKHIGVISENLQRFSGQGLQNVEALVGDTRRSVNRIEEAVSDFQRNPQRILSGGDGEVRQYDGRVRR